MKKILSTLILLLFVLQIQAQKPNSGGEGTKARPKIAKIFGVVLDSASQKPLEFATISVFSIKDSSLVGGQITDAKGKFEVAELPVGIHRVVIGYMGYDDKVFEPVKLGFKNPTKDMGKITIAPNAAMLKTAEVTAEKQVFQLGLDKKVFNVDKTNLGDSENATEVLRNTPTVEVDFEGGVKIRGSAVQVYVNGKPTGLTGDSQAEILDQLPANSIKSVELITNPSAKYDPEGESGIINIVLKKNVLEGFTGSVNASLGTSTWHPFQRYRGGLSLNYRNNKINIFSNFSYNNSKNYSKGYNYRSTYFADTATHMIQNSNNQRLRNGGMARVGMDYYFDDYNTLTFAARIRPSAGGNNSNIVYDYKDSARVTSNYDTRNTVGNQNRFNMTYNLIYSKVFKQKEKEGEQEEGKGRRDNSKDANSGGHKHWRGNRDGRAAGSGGTMGDKQELVIDLQYSMNSNREEEIYFQEFYDANWSEMSVNPDSQNTSNGRNMHQGTVRLDYTHPFSKKMKIETGYKGNIRWLGQDFQSESYDYASMQMLNDINLSNEFNYLEQVHAVYGTFAHQVGKLRYKLGIRLEQTFADGELVTNNQTFKNNYFSFFPSAHFSYELKKNQQVQLGYSRRINRPSTWQLNPFPSYSDPLNLRYGNPNLQPQYTNSFELSYVNYWKGGNTLMLTGFYRYNTNLMERLRVINSEGVSGQTYYNFNQSHVFGAEFTTRFVPFEWWNITLSGSLYQNMQDASNVNQSYVVNALAGNVNLGMNFVFKFGMRISLYAWYSLPTKTPQGSTSGYTWNSLSVSQKILKNKATITLSLNNPVLGGIWRYKVDDTNFYIDGLHQWEAPVFDLRFSYRFGKVNVRNSRSKNAGRLGGGMEDGDKGEGK